ncbi:MAG: TetR/AcrR family transcriptional regulator [Pseudomonadota bacterium]
MRLTSENKQKITARIRSGAAQVFREQGFAAVNLDALMKQAGLTRGAFYAHYRSKSALLSDVLRHEHPLLRMLEARDGTSGPELSAQMAAIFAHYLEPKNLSEVFAGCTLAALTGDATRADADAKAAYGAAFEAICQQMARGQEHRADAYAPALVLASGAVRTAQAVGDDALRENILRGARQAFASLLPQEQEG